MSTRLRLFGVNADVSFRVRTYAMNTEKAPMVNRLILLVLVLILGCLVVLIARQRSAEQIQRETALETPNQGDEALEKPPPRPTYLPVTNRVFVAPRGNSSAGPQFGRVNFGSGAEAPNRRQDVLPSDEFSEPILRASAQPPGVLAGTGSSGFSGEAEISGRVWLTGAPPPEIPIPAEGTTCANVSSKPLTTRHYVVTPDGRLANVLVYIKEGLEKSNFPVPTNKALLELSGCQYEPYIMGLQARQKLTIKNLDPILHNIHVTAKINRELNIGLRQRQANEISLARPEFFARLKCDLHPWEFAYLNILPHPFFAVTDAEGAFRLPAGLPAGKYLIAANHLKAGESVQELTVSEHETKFLNFTLSVPAPK